MAGEGGGGMRRGGGGGERGGGKDCVSVLYIRQRHSPEIHA